MKDFKLDNETRITSGFTTPDGYFDSFSEKVLRQLPKKEPKVISIFSSGKTWYYAAAAVIVFMLSIPLYTNYKASQEEIDTTTLENYIASNSTISQDEIVDLLEQEDLDRMKMELNVDDAAIEEVLKSNSNLEEYIID
jgi:cell division protein FtsL